MSSHRIRILPSSWRRLVFICAAVMMSMAVASAQVAAQETGLAPFGYRLFETLQLTPPQSVGPVDLGYVVGPDDEFVVHISGPVSERHTLTVDREGRIVLPKGGLLEV